MSLVPIATEGHNSDEQFGGVTEEPLYQRVTRIESPLPPAPLQRSFVVVISMLNIILMTLWLIVLLTLKCYFGACSYSHDACVPKLV
jgi:hypothetical protein